jgi:hypothetical protein
MGRTSGGRWGCDARPDRPWQGGASASARVVLSLTSIPVPPELLERLRLAASRLGLRHGVIAAAAIDRFLAEYGF